MEKKDEAKEAWLNSQKMPTKRYYRDWFAKFEEFTQMTGDQILAKQAVDKPGTWEVKVLAFKNWLLSEKKLSEYTATAMSMAARGFFSYHRQTLQFRPMESKRISERSRVTEDYRFNLADLKKLYEVSDLQERYVITAGKSFGLRAGDFLALTRGDLEPYISNEPPASIGRIKTEKEKVAAYPFIDSDAQPIIKLMLEKLTREGKMNPNDRILDFSQAIQLTRILKRLVAKAGLEVGNKEVRFHCLRKFLSDHLASYMAESKWKQVVGKKISEGAYISPDELRKDYTRAMEETTFGRQVDLEKRAQISEEITSKLMAGEPLNDEDRRNMRTYDIRLRERGKLHCTDGEHCQRIVTESELAEFLGLGWEVKAVLPSGKVVIDR
ncbi:site-specific integrase [Candidatus Bathyarchaeota archaeon]|nr:site-specific integrase [Candidatus Bathyarchaeota archaeon]